MNHKYKLEKNDVIITRSGTVGISKVFNLRNEDIIYIPSGYLIVVKIDENKLIPEFIEYFLNSLIMKKYFDVFGTGKTQKNISQTDIKRIPIPSFTKDEQGAISRIFKKESDKFKREMLNKEQEMLELNKKMNEIIHSMFLRSKVELEVEEE